MADIKKAQVLLVHSKKCGSSEGNSMGGTVDRMFMSEYIDASGVESDQPMDVKFNSLKTLKTRPLDTSS
jgi:hypothetical protein